MEERRQVVQGFGLLLVREKSESGWEEAQRARHHCGNFQGFERDHTVRAKSSKSRSRRHEGFRGSSSARCRCHSRCLLWPHKGGLQYQQYSTDESTHESRNGCRGWATRAGLTFGFYKTTPSRS